MKTKTLSYPITKWRLLVICILSVVLIACSNPDEVTPPDPTLTGTFEEYSLFSQLDPGIIGKVTFAERSDGITLITIELNSRRYGGNHPVHIHMNTAETGGPVVLDLSNVDPTGISVSEVNTLNDGSAVSYTDLVNFDGHINVRLNSNDLLTLIAQGDIGRNELNFVEFLTEHLEQWLPLLKAGMAPH